MAIGEIDMRKYNESNERIKRKYLTFLKQAKGQNEASLDAVAKAIVRFETYNKSKDFKSFHFEQAVGFKNYLAAQKHQKTGKPLSQSTRFSTARHLKSFFQWLSQEVGYRSRIKYSDAEYFNISEKESRVANAKRKTLVASIEQVKHTLSLMTANTDIEKRDRALIAFALLTGARDSAISSFKLKHIDFNANSIFQDARDVKTKFSKTFTTYFFPVGSEIRSIVFEWCEHLKHNLLFGPDDPIFPKTKIGLGKHGGFEPVGLLKEHWADAAAIRRIFKAAFEAADLPYFNPHSFRNTLANLGETMCQSPEEFKAWSQNLGHEKVMTTFLSYGEVADNRQADIFKQLKEPKSSITGIDSEQLLLKVQALINQ